jgi:hypothetical protein
LHRRRRSIDRLFLHEGSCLPVRVTRRCRRSCEVDERHTGLGSSPHPEPRDEFSQQIFAAKHQGLSTAEVRRSQAVARRRLQTQRLRLQPTSIPTSVRLRAESSQYPGAQAAQASSRSSALPWLKRPAGRETADRVDVVEKLTIKTPPSNSILAGSTEALSVSGGAAPFK